MPMPQNGMPDELKLQALREAEERQKAAQGIKPGRPRPTKYTMPGLTKQQLESLLPFYVDLGPKPPFLNPKRLKWYYKRHVERRKLRKKLREDYGITRRVEFETIAREVGLGIDNPILAWLWWFFSWLTGAGGIASVLGAAVLALSAFFVYSFVSEQVGSFTIQLNPGTMETLFALSDTETFESTTGRLISEEVDKVNAISVADLDRNIDVAYEGSHNGEHYVAYTFYIKNISGSTQSYEYVLRMTDSLFNTEKAVWIMLYEDGRQIIYAAPSADGDPERLCGYSRPPFFDAAYDCENQYYFYLRIPNATETDFATAEFDKNHVVMVDDDGNRVKFSMDKDGNIKITSGNLSEERKALALQMAEENRTWTRTWGVNTTPSVSEEEVVRGVVENIPDGAIHKYTVAIWVEGDDPECTDDLFGGYAKYMMEFYPTTQENLDLFKNIYRREYDITQ